MLLIQYFAIPETSAKDRICKEEESMTIKLSKNDCRILAVMALAAGFEDMVEHEPAENTELHELFRRVEKVFDDGLRRMGWYGRIHPKSIRRANGMVYAFEETGFKGKRNSQTYTSFCLGVLDDIYVKLNDGPKKEWVGEMIDIMTGLQEYFERLDGRRYDMCCVAGERAVERWGAVT